MGRRQSVGRFGLNCLRNDGHFEVRVCNSR